MKKRLQQTLRKWFSPLTALWHKMGAFVSAQWERWSQYYWHTIVPVITGSKRRAMRRAKTVAAGTIETPKHVFLTRHRRYALYGYLFIAIWLIGFAIFTLYPMGFSLFLSFQEAYYNLNTGITSRFIGFNNYLDILQSQTLLPLFATYIGKMVLAVPLIIVFSIVIAVLVNNPIKGKGVWRTIFFMPVIISTGPVLAELTAQDATSLPSLTSSFVYTYIVNNLSPLIANPLAEILNSMLMILWYAGIPILVFLAGLQKVDPALYEAAAMDGATAWDRFWKITLPSIKPLIAINVVYIVVSMSLYVSSGGILDLARTHMLVGASDSAFWHGYGYAAAIAWVYFFVMVLIMSLWVLLFGGFKKERAHR